MGPARASKILYKRKPPHNTLSIFGERASFLKGGGHRSVSTLFDTTGEAPVVPAKPFESVLLLDDFDRMYLGWLDKGQVNAEERKKAVRYIFRIVFGSKIIDKNTNTLYNKFEWAYLKWIKSAKAGEGKLPCAGSELFDDFKKSLLFRLNSLFYETGSAETIFGSSNTYVKQKKEQYYGLLKFINRMDNNPACYDYYNDTSLVSEDGTILDAPDKETRDDELIRRVLCNVYLSDLPEEQKREIIDEVIRRTGYVFDPATCSPSPVPGQLGAPPGSSAAGQPVPGALGAPPRLPPELFQGA